MSNHRITFRPSADATPQTEISALANVYAFILDRAKKNRGRLPRQERPRRPERT